MQHSCDWTRLRSPVPAIDVGHGRWSAGRWVCAACGPVGIGRGRRPSGHHPGEEVVEQGDGEGGITVRRAVDHPLGDETAATRSDRLDANAQLRRDVPGTVGARAQLRQMAEDPCEQSGSHQRLPWLAPRQRRSERFGHRLLHERPHPERPRHPRSQGVASGPSRGSRPADLLGSGERDARDRAVDSSHSQPFLTPHGPRSQAGQGSGLLIRRSWVRIPPGAL